MASIKQINERKYKITISNGYRPDGKKISRAKTITVPDNIRSRGIPQYVAHAAEEFERLIKNGFSEDSETTFEEYALRWLDRQTKYAPSTLASYRRMLDQVFPHIGKIKLNRLRPIALENLLIELRKRTHHGKPIQEATVQKYLTVVSTVLSDAKRNETIEKNPARMIDLPNTGHRTQPIPTDDEAKRLIKVLLDEQPHYRTFYLLAIYTGCRRGELCALKWTDFTQVENICVMTVSRSRSSVLGEGVVEGSTKSGHSRTIAIDNDMLRILRSYYRTKLKEAQDGGFPLSEYVFSDKHGRPPHPDTFSKRLRKIYKKNGFPSSFHLHTLRHYFVSTLLHSGVDRNTVAELAGHCDTSFLERTYCHPQMELKEQAASQMADQLFTTQHGRGLPIKLLVSPILHQR